jgi:hypothetical protein
VTGVDMAVTPDELSTAGNAIGGCAEDLGAGLQSLQATVTTDNPWGNDEPGSLFGMAYVAVLSHALEAIGSHVEQLVVAADGLTSWAASVAQTERDNADRFTALRSALGG